MKDIIKFVVYIIVFIIPTLLSMTVLPLSIRRIYSLFSKNKVEIEIEIPFLEIVCVLIGIASSIIIVILLMNILE